MTEEHNIPKVYDPASVEKKWYEFWEKNRYFHAEPEPGKKPFSIVIPPPNITGKLHMGHALDNTLQDILIRWHRMMGDNTLWMPGYDHAGLATQIKVEEVLKKEEGKTRFDLGREEFVKRVWAWKEEYGDRIINQLKCLGISCDWERKRFTMDEGCSRAVRETFVSLFEKGLIYKGTRITNWCVNCHTALSDIEVEHEDTPGHLWYLRYPVVGEEDTYLTIATTRPETIPGDTAVAVNPEDERYAKLIGKTLRLPILNREIPVIADSYVDTKFGTGAVKITPSHDPNDYEMGLRHNLPEIVVIGKDGVMTEEAGPFAGLERYECRKQIVARLKEEGYLVKIEEHSHAVGHCQRCHNIVEPLVSTQWFVKMQPLVKAAVDCVTDGRTQFVPERFTKNYTGWMENIHDWCISRQRVWGVPIPVFYCKKCGKYHITDASIKAVSDLFRKEGSDAWYKYDANDILPKTEVCECGASDWEKDPDIMDVWFDSGSTHAAVLEERPELRFPANMYMEGGDQFRGWFQSSLLTSVASKGCAPYKSVLCHGWVVDEQGKQMHKSAGNGVEPSEIIKDYGADIIRLWVASSDYTVDVRAGKNIFKQLSEAYRKIRNTARFILGNLDGFDPNTDCVADDQLQEIDRWALAALDDLIVNAKAGYDVYDFNKVYHAVYNFCVVAMSNFYLDVTKDRLYCTNGVGRKAAQTTMYKILVALDKIIAPILCFTSQEIWDFLPKTEAMNKYVVFEDMPKAGQYAADDAFKAKWAQLIAVRDEVKKVLEQARAEKTIGASLEASVTLYCNDAVYDLLNSIPMDELADLMIVSHVELVKGEGGSVSAVEGLGVAAAHATGEKCERCWKYSADIGTHAAHPTLCARCASVVEA